MCRAPRSWTYTRHAGLAPHDRASRPGVVEVDVRQQQRFDVRQADAPGRQVRFQCGQVAGGTRIDERDAGRAFQHSRRDHPGRAAELPVGVTNLVRKNLHGRIIGGKACPARAGHAVRPASGARRPYTGGGDQQAANPGPGHARGPVSTSMTDTRQKSGDLVLERTEKQTKEPARFKVLLINDDYTTMEFVVQVLETIFHKTPAEAFRIMMQVHTQGRGVCGVYTFEVAETKVEAVHDSRGRAASRCGRAWKRSKPACSAPPSSAAERRRPRGDVAPPCPPDARAPALRAGARHRGREDPRRLRRRPAAAARASSTSSSSRTSSSSPAAPRRSPSRRSPSGACCRRPSCTCRARARPRRRPATCWPPCSSRTAPTPRSCSRARASRASTSSTTSPTASEGARARRRGRDDGRPLPAQGEEGSATARDPLAAYAVNLTERARTASSTR